MITNILITGRVELGEFPLFAVDCAHQPVRAFPLQTQYQIPNIVENDEILEYHPCEAFPVTLPAVGTSPVLSDVTEWTWIYTYILIDAYNYAAVSTQFNRYHSAPDRYIFAANSAPIITVPRRIEVYAGINYAIYLYAPFAVFPSKLKYYQVREISSGKRLTDKPNYMALVDGYDLDTRQLPAAYPTIVPTETETVKIRYYRRNHLEAVPLLTSIDWQIYECQLTKGVPFVLPLKGCVLGTLKFESPNLLSALMAIPNPVDRYPYSSLLATAIPGLFDGWNELYNSYISTPPEPPDTTIFSSIRETITITKEEINRTLHVLGANNNVWRNRASPTPDLNFNAAHPMYLVDSERDYSRHVAFQIDGSFGTLIMDSPRIIEIHAALDAAKFANNSIEPDEPRVTNLGHLVAKTAELLGYHPNDNGEYIVEDEKKKTRRIVKDEERVDEAEYGGNYFASKGMLVKRVPNAFDVKGAVVSGGVAMVHNFPELLAEMQDQLNIALNIQESGAIEIKDGDRAYRYAGQLQLLTDLALAVAAIHQLAHQGYISSLVTQQQSGEIIAGMGLPTVSRVTNIAIDNKLQQIPYWGIAPQHSLARKIETVAYNVGIITGQLI